MADVGGIPGKNCRGFCKYCYFKKVKEVKAFGCKNCSPGKVGCPVCTKGISDSQNEFLPPYLVAGSIQNTLMMGNYYGKKLKVNITGGGDVSCYPYLEELTATFKQMGLSTHLGYTSGKGIDDIQVVENLINNGVDETTFTVFSTDPQLRKKWMGDPTPDVSIESIKRFCESCELHAAAVIIPGVNDEEILRQTCSDLEEWGAKAVILMRFANHVNQGLILRNEPIIKGIETHSVEEFEALVQDINNEFKLRVTGTPVCDPETEAPFAIALDKNKEFLQFIHEITGEATLISGKIAGPRIQKIFDSIGAGDKVNVYCVDQDIACLITRDDLIDIDLSQLKDTVILPGRAFVHDMEAQKILNRDGKQRIVTRGPDKLTVDGEASGTLTREEVIERELINFRELAEEINFFGMKY